VKKVKMTRMAVKVKMVKKKKVRKRRMTNNNNIETALY
jgi:hypothetical protein